MATPGGFQAGTAAVPSSQVEISVSCRNLRDMDYFSKSDPLCVMYSLDIKSQRFLEYGRTEMIQDNLNPEFAKKFVINYFFEEAQKLKFEIYDVDSTSQNLSNHDFIGSVELTLGEIVGVPGGAVVKKLRSSHPGDSGDIILRAEELTSSKEIATFHFKGSQLAQKNWWGLFGKSDPFLTFYRANEDNSYTVVHRTEVIKNTLNPNWKTFVILVRNLCNGDYDRSIKVECHDWNASGNHEYIGEFITNMRELSSSQSPVFELTDPKSRKKKSSGKVQVLSCQIEQQQSFLDFIKGGMQMNFTVAIDFTASNGNPQNPTSLHYYNPYQLNQYAAALSAVGEIIQDYDSDKMFPALGFGARMPDGSVSHEFALNFQPQNPYCAGIDGILAAYYHSLNCVQLYGPTNFAPVINHVARFAAAVRDGSEFFVLLIITDGIITDMPQTKSAIVSASTLPLSIIIVGVGDADFTAMDILDGDDQRLSANGKYAERDIVQFVPFRNFLSGGGSMHVSQAFLAKEVLAEVPDQVLSYMKRYNIKARPPAANQNAALAPAPAPQGAPAAAPAFPRPGAPMERPPPYQM
ncbi:copine-8 [Aplysia californica]|uniref:Copine-8 n=1 Tax=Aplysia californica TaxID=6500 RepID=A0ABM0ZZE4_APLCA|nr:copine-8 [Aplysia californica]